MNIEKDAPRLPASRRLAQFMERAMVSEVAGVPAVFIGITVAAVLFGGLVAVVGHS